MILLNLLQISLRSQPIIPNHVSFFSARLTPSDVSKRNVTVNRSTRCNPFTPKDEVGVNSGEQFKAFSSVKYTIQISPEGSAQVVYHSIRYPQTPCCRDNVTVR